MTLQEHLQLQGITGEDALELLDRKAKKPSLNGVTFRGRYVSLVVVDAEKFDEMVESGIPPVSKTDVEFLKGSENGSQFANDPFAGDYYASVAKKAGVSITGKKYLGQLAKYPGDPKAWVSCRGDVQQVCEERGWGSEGNVNVKMRERENPPSEAVPIADDIVNKEVIRELAGQTVKVKEAMDVREKVTDRLTPKWKKKRG